MQGADAQVSRRVLALMNELIHKPARGMMAGCKSRRITFDPDSSGAA